ncbi:MAG: transposase family protein, partial [Xanthobacteraceae bacterium]
MDYDGAWNLPLITDGTSNEANSAALGYVLVPWFSTRANSARDFRRSEGPRDHTQAALKETACGCCGRVQMGWYDRKVRRVRDLSCGDKRIFLELEVRRID